MRKLFYIWCVVFCAACGQKAPTDAQLQDLCRDAGFAVAEAEDKAQRQAVFVEAMRNGCQEFDINKITPAQIDMMFEGGGAMLGDLLRDWFQPLLEKKSGAKGNEGLTFSFYRWKYLPTYYHYGNKEVEEQAYRSFVSHPDFEEWLTEYPNHLDDVVRGTAQLGGDTWVKLGVVDAVVALVKHSLPEQAVFSSMNIFNAAFVSKQLPEEKKNEIRESVLGQYQALLRTERYAEGRRRESVEEGIRYLESPYATGTLVGNAAPELDFLWLSDGDEKTLADLKGKVVVLDFWATKCAPCISSFPYMRQVREHYAKCPVEIIGVTSIMGYHHDPKTGKFISTDGKPEYEMELMREFMRSMDMTWRVAFTKQWVMNLDYGVLGIPHLTIVDAKGNVRYNGVSLADVPAYVDGLLKEAGLPCPTEKLELEIE